MASLRQIPNALSRLAHGIAELTKAGLKPDYFEMPHYRASPMAYRWTNDPDQPGSSAPNQINRPPG